VAGLRSLHGRRHAVPPRRLPTYSFSGESRCLSLGGFVMGTCFKTCSSATDCRAGYSCGMPPAAIPAGAGIPAGMGFPGVMGLRVWARHPPRPCAHLRRPQTLQPAWTRTQALRELARAVHESSLRAPHALGSWSAPPRPKLRTIRTRNARDCARSTRAAVSCSCTTNTCRRSHTRPREHNGMCDSTLSWKLRP